MSSQRPPPSDDEHSTPREIVAFFDPILARLPRPVDLVRVLLDETHATEPIQITGPDETVLLSRLTYHRLVPQLRSCVKLGRISVSDRLREQLDRLAAHLAIRTLQQEHTLVTAVEALASFNVETLALKGAATSRLDFDDPTLRQALDTDLLVRRRHLGQAFDALSSVGYQRPAPADTLMDKGETWTGPNGDSLDLHTRLHATGRELREEWWERSEHFRIGAHEIRALGRSGRLAHAASHLALSYPNHRILSSLLDIVVVGRLTDDAERAGAQRFLDDLGVGDIVFRITRRASALLDDPGVVLGRPGRRPLDVALRVAYDRPDLDMVVLKLAKVFGMPWPDRRRVIRNWVAPTSEFLTLGGYISRWDRVAKVARRIRAR